MKLRFKKQIFQLDAVRAVVNCFEGQQLESARFTLERTKDLIRKIKQDSNKSNQTEIEIDNDIETSIGYRNRAFTISETHILNNIKAIQDKNDIELIKSIDYPPKSSKTLNLTIEMETGTGKTYTYIRTMYELNKKYGWSKFIIIVPSIAIREGVFQSFRATEEHFLEEYGHKIIPFIYNSSRPQDIEHFASDSRISVMIINTQAFAAKGADARKITQEDERFANRVPMEIIAQTNPILIMDEPQSSSGDATQEKIKDFKPLFILRYSATHKDIFNLVYRLDALDAYNQKLVKKIEVKGITIKGIGGTSGYLYLSGIEISPNKPPRAIVEYDKRTKTGVKRVVEKLENNSNLYELSEEIQSYKHCSITNIDASQGKIEYGGKDIYVGEAVGDLNENVLRRIQIRETIKSHLEKERQLFEKGIKVLSLFFIDKVENYKFYNESGDECEGEFANIFEQEYNNLVNEYTSLFQQEYNDYLHEHSAKEAHSVYYPKNYYEYLLRDDAKSVHQGYFSIDKKSKRAINSTVKRGSEGNSDDESAYNLIMKNKERLLSFGEPVRFIFSHSALKEGWDNPNVFQICALKHSDAVIRRRQEVGRGMRLCVNKEGIRQDAETINEHVHKTNLLTVVASESYEDFAKGLQNEIKESIKDRPQKANTDYFIGKVVFDENNNEIKITKDIADKINKNLFKLDIINDDNKITDYGKQVIEENGLRLPEELSAFNIGVSKLLSNIINGELPEFENANKKVSVKLNSNYHKKEFQDLWNKISFKSTYEVKFDTEKLIENSITRINANLSVSFLNYLVKKGVLEKSTKEDLEKGEGFRLTDSQREKIKGFDDVNVVYDLVGEIINHTNLTRKTIVGILSKIKQEVFEYFKANPEEFILGCSKLINEVKSELIINHITYFKSDEKLDSETVFGNDQQAIIDTTQLKRHIYDYLITDSKTELKFAQELDAAKEVNVFAKMPKAFYITTPVGKYSPDWAIVFNDGFVKNIYFVVETKGDESQLQLKEMEKLKRHCAEKHFEVISDNTVKYHLVATYESLLNKIQN